MRKKRKEQAKEKYMIKITKKYKKTLVEDTKLH